MILSYLHHLYGNYREEKLWAVLVGTLSLGMVTEILLDDTLYMIWSIFCLFIVVWLFFFKTRTEMSLINKSGSMTY